MIGWRPNCCVASRSRSKHCHCDRFWEPLLWGSSDVEEGEEDMAVSVDILSQCVIII